MRKWQRRAVGILTLGGSSVGLAAIASEISFSQLAPLSLVVVAMFAALFCFGIAVGVLIVEDTHDALSLALPFWLAQIPAFQSPWISYELFTGAKFTILFQSALTINFEWAGGSHFNLYLFPGDPGAIGVNIVAIVVSVWIWKNRNTAQSDLP